ncbi:MAG TPA: NF038122 family metalloprotease [Candidatus Limnocylindrales bacterium]|nr:NF038122 family metalloprotease [Candidatus Limnocylindrales bacterium]
MKLCALGCALGALLTLSSVARADIIINPTYDASIQNDPNHVAIENAIQSAIQVFENLIVTPITVQIYFEEAASPYLGASIFEPYNASYNAFYQLLVANDANPAAIAALQANSVPGDTNHLINPASLTNNIEIKSSNARALGFGAPADCVPTAVTGQPVAKECVFGTTNAVDGIIALNTSITFPPNGTGYSLISVAEHEIDEILGLGSALENCDPTSTTASATCKAKTLTLANDTGSAGTGSPEDLYRWNSAGQRAVSVDCTNPGTAMFSYGPSTGNIAGFNNACNGADFEDWDSAIVRVQNAFATSGANPTLGSAEIDALTAIGYEASPEPGTLALMLLPALALLKKRK